jgi:DNA-binding transcriptional regulator YdaS (Cro superfamily)
MRTQDAISHFGSQAALAVALGIKQQSVQDWGEIVPKLRQLQLERLTKGKLKADPEILNVAHNANAAA